MSPSGPLRKAAPAFLLGLSLALAGQMGAGLLLYGGPGLIQALSVILATLALALASGILAVRSTGDESGAPRTPSGSSAEHARRGWLALLLTLSLAALFSMGWELFRGFSAQGLAQGVGLGIGLALPFHAGGRLLGHLGRAGSGVRHPASAALVGAAAGFLLLGLLLFPSLSPTAVILLGVVAASGGALAHGWLLDEVLVEDRTVLAPGPAPGVASVELVHLRRARPPVARVRIEEGEKVRMEREASGAPCAPLDQVLEEALLPLLPRPERVAGAGWRALPLVVRSGAGALRLFGAAHPPAVARLLEAWSPLPADSSPLRLVSLPELVSPVPGADGGDGGGSSWLVLDAEATGGPESGDWAHHAAALGPAGVLVVVGLPDGAPVVEGGAPPPPDPKAPPVILAALEQMGQAGIPAVAYAGPADPSGSGAREGVLLAGPGIPDLPGWPDRAGEFALVLRPNPGT